uniref:Uncharacterized protein n=1 Tax=Amphimedon queenslandica TaxID=400682 RepID=A0A1X7UWE2_AMPQE
MEDILSQLIINWDQTGIFLVPGSSWNMSQSGSRRLKIVGLGDKRQITALFETSISGDFLPPQLIFILRKLQFVTQTVSLSQRLAHDRHRKPIGKVKHNEGLHHYSHTLRRLGPNYYKHMSHLHSQPWSFLKFLNVRCASLRITS